MLTTTTLALIAIRGVAVLDLHAAKWLTNRTVVVAGERIQSVSDARGAKTPRGARIIDGRGKFLIPGLIDAHVHLVHQANFAHVSPDELLPLYLRYGVTSVRSTGDQIVAEKMAQRHAEANPSTCPRVFSCSPLIDGDPPHHADIGHPLTDPAKVAEFVADMKAWDATTLKIYVRTGRDVGRLVIDEGHRANMVVAGHLGAYQAADAVADGIDVLEHIWSVINYSFPPGPRNRANIDLFNPTATALRDLIVRHGTMVDPTLAVFRNMILLNDMPEVHNHPDNAAVPQRLRDHWDRYKARSSLQIHTRDARVAEFRKYQELTGLLYRAGVPILAGTDTPEPYVPPGAALHQELELLVESGLPPAAALAAATVNNARALRREADLGSIEPGKLADMVLLDADPLADIRNTRRISAVFRGGVVAMRP